MSTQAHRSDVITKTRQASTKLLSAVADLEECAAAWNGRNLKAQVIAPVGVPGDVGYKANDFVGNEGITKVDINQALGTALDALRAFTNGAEGQKLEDIAI